MQSLVIKLIDNIQLIILQFLAILILCTLAFVAADAARELYLVVMSDSNSLIGFDKITNLLGAFLSVLIVVELLENVLGYLKDHVIHVEVAVVTAIVAVARKIIIVDYVNVNPMLIVNLGGLILALGACYYLLRKSNTIKNPSLADSQNVEQDLAVKP
ncbi:MAG: hypothetical protein OHK0017_09430 [Patescibacteria group bacterium]